MPTQLLEVHWVILYFVYGQVFFLMGLVTGLQWRRRSRLELARALPCLATFGLAHGLTEWGYIFVPMQAQQLFGSQVSELTLLRYIFVPLEGRFDLPPLVVVMIAAHLLLLAVSFFCLLRFGVQLLLPLVPRQRWLRAAPFGVLGLWAVAVIAYAVLSREPLNVVVAVGDGWSRYFMAFPGAILAHLGLLRQARQINALGLPNIAVYLTGAAVAFSVYGLVGGLIVPTAPYFPASVLNYDLLNRTVQVPAPVFRSVCGLAMAFFVVRFLEVFEVETERLIAGMERQQVLAADRERIGRELHDGIIQDIYAAGLALEDARHLIGTDTRQARQRIGAVMNTLGKTIQDIRGYIFDLQTGASPHELGAILSSLVGDLRLESLLDVNLDVAEHCRQQLTPQQTSQLIQIAREALRNVVQHAEAGHVTISVRCMDDGVHLTVADDGRGIDPETLAHGRARGRGLNNMRARARLIGGDLTMETKPGEGVRLTVTAPYGDGNGRS